MLILGKVLNFLGSGLCHQSESVTFSTAIRDLSVADKTLMPFCSRCSGIYIGFIFSLIIIMIVDHHLKGEIPSFKILALILGAVFIMGADVASSFFGILKPNNYIRFSTGFFTGWTIILLFLPLANNTICNKSVRKPYLNTRTGSIAWSFSGAILLILIIILFRFSSSKLMINLMGIFSTAGVLIFYSFIILILFFAIFKKFRNSIKTSRQYIISFMAGIFASAALLFSSALIRRFT